MRNSVPLVLIHIYRDTSLRNFSWLFLKIFHISLSNFLALVIYGLNCIEIVVYIVLINWFTCFPDLFFWLCIKKYNKVLMNFVVSTVEIVPEHIIISVIKWVHKCVRFIAGAERKNKSRNESNLNVADRCAYVAFYHLQKEKKKCG